MEKCLSEKGKLKYLCVERDKKFVSMIRVCIRL